MAMYAPPLLLFLLLGVVEGTTCPCSDEKLCQPLTLQREREGYGFWAASVPLSLNLDLVEKAITTIAWPPTLDIDPQAVCKAHEHNIRLVRPTPAPKTNDMWYTEEGRAAYALEVVEYVKSTFADGVVFDVENAMAPNDPMVKYYPLTVAKVKSVLHEHLPGTQVSVCVPWSAHNIDGRFYDWVALADASDYLYIMSYDVQSQVIQGRCIAQANCPATAAQEGAMSFLSLGIPSKKLILGVPWYGFSYACQSPMEPSSLFCPLALSPFRGVNCSDAVGKGVTFTQAQAMIANSTTGRLYDAYQQTPFMNIMGDGMVVHQVWWDDVESLTKKYDVANQLGLGGVGPYQFNNADPTTKEGWSMFEAMAKFVQKHS